VGQFVALMMICIANVLTSEALEKVRSHLDSAPFVDGKTTAGWHARLVKHNQQVPANAPALEKVRSIIQTALQQHPVFQMAALPQSIAPILLSRYEPGMSYGSHVDNAYMNAAAIGSTAMRSDLSMTLFLSDPEDYEGGELVIESSHAEQPVKLAAGSLVLYPSTTLHRVETVTAGVRLAAVTWIQSLVRDAAEREILFDLDTARQAIFAESGKTAAFDLLSKSYTNLLRKWGA
jgi:PKHD-type hydroxylase